MKCVQNGNATTPSVTANETATSAANNPITTDDDEIVTSVTLVLPNSRTALTSSNTTSVTMNVPAAVMSSPPSSTAIKKTDLDVLSMKASPTKQNTSDGNNQTLTKFSTDALQSNQVHKDSMYGFGITDDDKNGKAAIHKRSLLDIDNASSLSLADKLRNEANKYSDENAGREHFGTNRDALNVATTEQSNKKTGSPITPTSPTALYQPSIVASSTSNATTTLNSHTNERRPSWRIRSDTGCKVTFSHNSKSEHLSLDIRLRPITSASIYHSECMCSIRGNGLILFTIVDDVLICPNHHLAN